MFASQGSCRRPFFWAFGFFCALLLLSLNVQATPPTSASGRCQVILKYEGVCGNNRPNHCNASSGYDYDNPEHAQIWTDYYELCVSTTPSENRYSHECIAFLGIGSSCTSTVEPLIEYQFHGTIRAEVPVYMPETRYSLSNEYVVYTCFLTVESRAKVDAYHAACGDVLPASCGASSSIVNNYKSVCNEKTPCSCMTDMHCSATYCPAPAPPGGGAGGGVDGGGGGGTPGGGGGPSGSGGSVETGAPGSGPNVNVSAAPGDGGNVNAQGSSEPSKSSGGGSSGSSGSGCAIAASASSPVSWIFAFHLWLFTHFYLRLRRTK